VNLVCDAQLIPYYERFGMRGLTSAMLRHPAALEDPPPVHDPAGGDGGHSAGALPCGRDQPGHAGGHRDQ
jgi:hypothetical protein